MNNPFKNLFNRKEKKVDKTFYREFGVSGTSFTGDFDNEYNSDLKDMPSRMKFYDKMFRSEPSVLAPCEAVILPMLSANYQILAGGEDDKAQYAADFIKEMFWGSSPFTMKQSFTGLLEQVLWFVFYGFSAFEKVWAIKEGYIVIDRLEERLQRSIEWEVEDGEVKFITQPHIYGWKMPEKIPIEKCLIFTHKKRGSDPEGIGIFRQQYKSWKMLQKMYNLMAVGFERFMVGTIIGKLPQKTESSDLRSREAFKKILSSWTSHQNGYVTLPFGYEIEIHESNFTGAGVALQFIKELKQDLFLAALAQFLLLGSGGTGSYALSSDQTDFSLMRYQAILDHVCEIFNGLIREVISYNFTDVKPPVMVAQVKERDIEQTIKTIRSLVQSSTLPNYPELMEFVADSIEVPHPQGGFEQFFNNQADNQDSKITEQKEACGCDITTRTELQEGFTPKRSLNKHEEKVGGIKHFSEMLNKMKKLEKDYIKEVQPVVNRQVKSVYSEAKKRISSNAPLESIKVPDIAKYREISESYILESALFGIENVVKESKAAGEEIPKERIDKLIASVKIWAKQKAQGLTQKHEADIRFFAINSLTDAKLAGNNISEEVIEKNAKNMANQSFRKILDELQRAGRA